MDEPVSKSTVAKVADQAHAATDRVAQKATASDAVHNSLDSVAKRADAIRQGPNDLLEAGAEYIRARPYAAVGFALALGYLVGRLRS